MTRCGFVAVLGAPNAGKSTLVNRLVGSKVSIVSPKVQTTRTRVMGIVNAGEAQVVFVDTPGIFAPKKRLEKAMVAAAWQGAAESEHVLLLIDAAKGKIGEQARLIAEKLKSKERKALVALNKTDLAPKEKLLEMAAGLAALEAFTDVYMISAKTGNGTERLLKDLAARVPEGPWMFDPDQLSDMPQRLLAAEIVREKIFLQLGDELPYACAVETDVWDERPDGSASVEQTIYVLRESQKGIVLGKQGTRIGAIGTAARLELEDLLGRRVHLRLFVKVRENWTDDPDRYRVWGLDFKA